MGRRPAAPTPKLAFTASPAVNAWIQTGVSASAFEALGKAEGLVTLHQHRLQWVEAGVTTRAELRRVLVGSTNG
jgi:type II secretory ATPase GspE/PulE/Tfp pilus assembly ATPase PilB-like protein